MIESMGRKLALAVAAGIVAGVAGCGGAPAPPPEVPGAPVDDAQGAMIPASSTPPPAEKHSCGGANGCSVSAMPGKGAAPQPPPSGTKVP